LQLVALVCYIGEIEVQFANMLKPDIPRANKRGQPAIRGAADFDNNLMVEGSDGNFVELFAGQAEVLEVCGAYDLVYRSVRQAVLLAIRPWVTAALELMGAALKEGVRS
jgi:hypothetical protein